MIIRFHARLNAGEARFLYSSQRTVRTARKHTLGGELPSRFYRQRGGRVVYSSANAERCVDRNVLTRSLQSRHFGCVCYHTITPPLLRTKSCRKFIQGGVFSCVLGHLLWQTGFKNWKRRFQTPSKPCLTRETGESGPIFFKSHQSFREWHPTPLAIYSGYHFEKCRQTPVSSKSVSDAIYSKIGPILGWNVDI